MFAFIWRKNRRTPAARKPQSRFRPRLEALEDRCLLSGGVLDPTFGSGGIVTTTTGALSNAVAVATYPAATANAGDVVAVGDATVGTGTKAKNEPAIVRYNTNGTLDTSFGGTGEVIMNLKNGGVARDVVVQPDGKIVVAYQSGGTFDLARYNANGSLDTSFGGQGTGMVSTHTGKFTTDTAYSLGLEPNGDIVVAGTVSSSTGTNLAVLRYTAGGFLDASFGTGGIVTTQLPAPVWTPNANVNWIDLALDTSPSDPNAGDIVVDAELNTTGLPAVVVRYNAGGSLDTSFAGGAGYETLSNLGHPSVAIESNGDIIVAGGNIADSVELDCLNPNGSFNTTFGSGGIAVLNQEPNTNFVPRDVTIQADGQIMVAGVYDNNNTGAVIVPQNFFVARFNSADGSLDSSFGTGGVAFVSSGSNVGAAAVSLALEPDGRIVVAGTPSSTPGFTLARFVAYGPEVGSFTASPTSVAAGSDLTLTAGNITDEIPSATITQVTFYYYDRSGNQVTLGTVTVSNSGTWTLTSQTAFGLPVGKYTIYAQAEDSYGIVGDLASLALTVQ